MTTVDGVPRVEKKLAITVPGNAAIPWLVGGGVHGSAGPLHQVDGLPCTDLVGLRGTSLSRFRLKARQPNSFSFSIPTPVIFGVSRARLSRVLLLFKLDDSARLSRLSVMDGPNELFHLQFPSEHRYVAPAPDAASPDEMTGFQSWDIPGVPEVFWGIGIGVIIDPVDGDADVTFLSAGVEFLVDSD
ncbi:MAG: hypothetical protein ABI718_15230 [Acidobacteriota bacterium]